jgi:hypothetical protein
MYELSAPAIQSRDLVYHYGSFRRRIYCQGTRSHSTVMNRCECEDAEVAPSINQRYPRKIPNLPAEIVEFRRLVRIINLKVEGVLGRVPGAE